MGKLGVSELRLIQNLAWVIDYIGDVSWYAKNQTDRPIGDIPAISEIYIKKTLYKKTYQFKTLC